METNFLNRQEASEYLLRKFGIHAKPATLAKYATLGGGPIFQRAGRYPIYMPENLDAWAAARLSRLVRSTSELKAKDDTSASTGIAE